MRTENLVYWPAVAVAALLACGPKDDGTAGSTDTTTAGGSSSTGPTTTATDGSSSAASSTGAPLMVECDGVACLTGQLCVTPPSQCDYSMTAGMIDSAPPGCADFPAACTDKAGDALQECLLAAFCSASVMPELSSYDGMGTVQCSAAWLDCF